MRLGLVAGVGALALGCEWLGFGGGSVGLAAADLAVGATFLASGFAVWRPGGRDRIALLFLATGVTWFLGTLVGSDVAALSAIGAALLYAHRGPAIQLIFSYPTGRPSSRASWVVIGVAYVDGLIVSLAQDDAVTIALAVAVVAAAAVGVRDRDTA